MARPRPWRICLGSAGWVSVARERASAADGSGTSRPNPLCEALNDAGVWQAVLRVRVAHRQALRRDRDGTAFNFRPTPEDVVSLNLALDALRAEAHDVIRSRNR